MASDDLIIEVAGSSSLAQPARQALEECMKTYGEDVLREAGRLEASLHVGGGDPMITNSMIQEANLLGRRGHIQRRTPKSKHTFQLVSYAAAVVAGVFAGDIEKATGAIGFAVSATVGIVAFFLGRNDG
ncbi:hypothetical protein [Streptomyces nigra]|uniref:Uncharacterized protein n=1 Tax=Streptomyces nigra TaxID=1827580 RepID=A0ABZ1IVE0_9ACTN